MTSTSLTVNPRTAHTRQQLREALVALVVQQGYESVTARQIAAEAGVSYKTLYRHFSNKEELLFDILFDLAAGIRDRMVNHSDAALANARELFEFVRTEESRCRVIIDPHVAILLTQPLLPLVAQMSQTILAPLSTAQGEMPPMLHEHILWTTIGLVRWWLAEELSTPVEKMAHTYITLVTHPAQALFQTYAGESRSTGCG